MSLVNRGPTFSIVFYVLASLKTLNGLAITSKLKIILKDAFLFYNIIKKVKSVKLHYRNILVMLGYLS